MTNEFHSERSDSEVNNLKILQIPPLVGITNECHSERSDSEVKNLSVNKEIPQPNHRHWYEKKTSFRMERWCSKQSLNSQIPPFVGMTTDIIRNAAITVENNL